MQWGWAISIVESGCRSQASSLSAGGANTLHPSAKTANLWKRASSKGPPRIAYDFGDVLFSPDP